MPFQQVVGIFPECQDGPPAAPLQAQRLVLAPHGIGTGGSHGDDSCDASARCGSRWPRALCWRPSSRSGLPMRIAVG